MNYMRKWGFLTDPKNFVGKTIINVESLQMEFGCTYTRSLAFEFSDGSRGWILGHSGSNCAPNPQQQDLEKSTIVRPEEFGQYMTDKKSKEVQRRNQELRRKREQLEQLKSELGVE